MGKMNYVTKIIEGIVEQLYSIHDTKEESWNEVIHYVAKFRNEVDFNIASYGNLLCYYVDVRKFYDECGFPKVNDLDDCDLWELYKKDVGQVVKLLIYKNEKLLCPVSIASVSFVASFE